MKLLLVEDDNEVRMMLGGLLRQLGHDVTEAADGKLGLELFRAGSFEVILTDLVMPHKDGVEMITAIRRLNPTVPIIAITGGYRTDSLQSIANASAAGANEILYKPFDISELQHLLRSFQPSNP